MPFFASIQGSVGFGRPTPQQQSVVLPGVGGSIYFDGTTTGNVSIANDTDLRMATGDFTIEWFMYPVANTNSYYRTFSIGTYSTQSIAVSFENPDGARIFYVWVSAANIIVSSTNYRNAWYHIAISRSGTSLRIFVNGTQVGTTLTNSTNFSNSTDVLRIGNESTTSTGSAFKGYITNFRWVKGTAIYTSNFTTPKVPLSSVSNTKLLLLATSGATYTNDSSGLSKTVTNGGTAVWNALTPFVGYTYYRWRITATMTMPPNANACQVSEFVFQAYGVDQQTITSSATVTSSNPIGTFNAGEEPSKLVDANINTKMCDVAFVTNGNITSIIFQFSSPQVFNGYRWATANDESGRDPTSWTLSAGNDGTTWTTLHTVTSFSSTTTRLTYNTAFTY